MKEARGKAKLRSVSRMRENRRVIVESAVHLLQPRRWRDKTPSCLCVQSCAAQKAWKEAGCRQRGHSLKRKAGFSGHYSKHNAWSDGVCLIERGVKRGSVLSRVLFLLVMDPLLRQLQASGLRTTSMRGAFCMLMTLGTSISTGAGGTSRQLCPNTFPKAEYELTH